ncbi:MAG: glycosyltransferase family 4 protein [Patescibacteria group bacterium]|nr:glycosyltransferase family 4 protein [Patescibacteria group bacterium]MDE1966139.1 glycosyltransferase family 4 protein [Patescibacteria group bacterium]
MRLVIATPLYPPESGGPATYAKALQEGLPKRGIEVVVVKFADVRHLPKLVRHVAYLANVLREARRADAVLALDPVSVGLPACLAARRAKKPFVVKIVGDYAWEQGRQRFGVYEDLDAFVKERRVSFPVWFLRRVETGVAAYARLVIVPSEYLKGIVTAWGIAPEKIRVIYNAVPFEAGASVPAEVAALPRPLIVSAGRLVPWKHMEGVVSAVAMLRARGTDVSLALVGDGPERERLAAYGKARLPDGFLMTGQLSHRDTLAVVAAADVFVLNSSYEGLSHLLIEALALGAPIVATDAGGNPEVIADGKTGLLVPVKDTEALAAALSRMLGDEPLRESLRAAAKASAPRFSEEALCRDTATTLASVV